MWLKYCLVTSSFWGSAKGVLDLGSWFPKVQSRKNWDGDRLFDLNVEVLHSRLQEGRSLDADNEGLQQYLW